MTERTDQWIAIREARGIRGRMAYDQGQEYVNASTAARYAELQGRGVPEARLAAVDTELTAIWGSEGILKEGPTK